MVSHARQLRRRQSADRRHSSADAQLLFWRRDARGFLTAEGSWRPASFRYCWLRKGRAAVVTRKASKSEILPEAQAGVALEAGQNDPVERRLLATPSNGPAAGLALIERVALDH